MTPAVRRLKLLRRMATWCAALVLSVICISAFIRLSAAGQGCTDLPRCSDGRQLQGRAGEADRGATMVAARMVHRVVAVATLLLIVAMLIAVLAVRPIDWRIVLPVLGLLALALALAGLGRWSGTARVPAVAVGNLIGGFLMLALCWRLRGRIDGLLNPVQSRRLGRYAGPLAVILLGQIALGALVSAGVVSAPAHGTGALLITAAAVPLCLAAWRRGARRPALVVFSVLAAQIALGLLLVVESLPLGFALAHNLLAAVLLAAVFSLA